ncbi:unnamed protein product [Leuciscus chuanchicus]
MDGQILDSGATSTSLSRFPGSQQRKTVKLLVQILHLCIANRKMISCRVCCLLLPQYRGLVVMMVNNSFILVGRRVSDGPQVGEGDVMSDPGGVDGPRELSEAECLMVTADVEGQRSAGRGGTTQSEAGSGATGSPCPGGGGSQ